MPFEIRITRTFCASHQVRMYDGELEPLHGHNWNVTVTVGSDKLDQVGFVTDFHVLEHQLDAILSQLDNLHLNDVPMFSRLNPSAENVALAIAESMRVAPPARVVCVEVTEAPGCSAIYRPGT
ncbi:MAG: 6-carboxytetrahydropterin synthase [Burkholderiales bacterium]|nr:6-carboxytetrahydropterin synthase [Phycisphaerae bacterium]